MGVFYIGDALFQLFSFGLIIFLIYVLFRFFSNRGNKLDRIEKKIDAIHDQIRKDNA